MSNERKIDFPLYITAFFLALIIFISGIIIGKGIETSNIENIEKTVEEESKKLSALQMLFFIDENEVQGAFCSIYEEELQKIDREVEILGYKLTYLEEKKGIINEEIKKRYFVLETTAYFLSKKVKERCKANYSLILYFYSNKNCTKCKEQGLELLEVKKIKGERVRIYSFDGDLNSKVVDALKNLYKVEVYPTLVINGKKIENMSRKEKILKEIN